MKPYFAFAALLFLAACASAPRPIASDGYFEGDWTFNGGLQFWLRVDGTYVWRQSLFFCTVDSDGNGGWINQEQGTWSLDGQTIVLHSDLSSISNAYVADLYFGKHRAFALGGEAGHRVLVSGAGDDSVIMKETKDINHEDPTIKNRPNQALERNDPSRHASCCAPVAPTGIVVHLQRSPNDDSFSQSLTRSCDVHRGWLRGSV